MPPATRDPETYAILGVAMRVHRELGCGFLEAVYHEALCHALDVDGVSWQREVPFRISFAGQPLRATYRADLVCFDRVLVELKALRELGGAEIAQVLNYLKASGLERALLLNFGAPRLEYRRLVSSPQISQIDSTDCADRQLSRRELSASDHADDSTDGADESAVGADESADGTDEEKR